MSITVKKIVNIDREIETGKEETLKLKKIWPETGTIEMVPLGCIRAYTSSKMCYIVFSPLWYSSMC